MKFTDLEVWKEAHQLTLLVYTLTKKFPKEEVYALTNQIRRAVVSIESCIAEGFSRYHFKDRLNLYYDAGGSLAEVESQSITAKDLEYISELELKQVVEKAATVHMLLGGLIRSTQHLANNKKSGILADS
jgi:four helix bundle protein